MLTYKIINKLRHLFRKNAPIFESVEIETTSICNRKCIYCPNSICQRPQKLMKTSTYKKIIDDLASIKFSGPIYPHHYGEPLLDKRLEKLIIYTKNKLPLSQIKIFTNGDFLTLKRFDSLIKAGADLFQITNHDNTLPTHIKILLRNPKNKKYINFSTIDPQKTSLFNRGGLLKNSKTILVDKCFIVNILVIDYSGNVTLCCNDFLSKYIFGNVLIDKIIDIWNQKKYIKLRQEINQGIFTLPICKKCTDKSTNS